MWSQYISDCLAESVARHGTWSEILVDTTLRYATSSGTKDGLCLRNVPISRKTWMTECKITKVINVVD